MNLIMGLLISKQPQNPQYEHLIYSVTAEPLDVRRCLVVCDRGTHQSSLPIMGVGWISRPRSTGNIGIKFINLEITCSLIRTTTHHTLAWYYHCQNVIVWHAPGCRVTCTGLSCDMHRVVVWHAPGCRARDMHRVVVWHAPGVMWHAPGCHVTLVYDAETINLNDKKGTLKKPQ